MTRSLAGWAAAAFMVLSLNQAAAQSAPSKPRAPEDIRTASELLIVKNEACRREAREQKLSFFKRRLFMHRCLHPR